jgi:hypothetical protein
MIVAKQKAQLGWAFYCNKLGFIAKLRNPKLLVHYVHSYFKAKTHFCSSWFSPHNKSPKGWFIEPTKCLARWMYYRQMWVNAHAQLTE